MGRRRSRLDHPFTGTLAGVWAVLLAAGLGLLLACHSFAKPEVTLVAAKPDITQGGSTTLTAQLPGGGGTGNVDQGVGTVRDGVPVTVSPTVTTTYTLTFTGYFGSIKAAATVTVVPPSTTPVISAPAFVTAGVSGLTASVPAQPGSSYAWTITGGTITAGAGTTGITFTAGASGSVLLGCEVTNAAGASSAPASATSVIVPQPVTPVITAPATVTAGAAGRVASVPAQAGSTYAWTITGGTITAGGETTTITFTPGASGSVLLGCTVTNAAGTASAPGSATCAIVAVPGTPVITAPATVTAGAAGLAASVPAQAGSSYAWTISGGTITAGATTAAITFTAGAAGPLLLGCTITNAAGTPGIPGAATVTVVAAPTAPVITAPAAVTTGAAGVVASVPAQAGSTYAWTISGGTITAGATTTSITFTAGASGSVLLSCTVTNAAGTVGTPGTATIAIVAVPTAPVISAPASVTGGTAGLAASVPAQAAGSSYAWTITGGTITAGGTTTSITFTAGASGSVVLTCTVTNAAGTAGAPGTATITIVAAPTAPVITAPATVTGGTAGLVASVPAQAGSSYAWTITGGTITAGATTTSITFTAGASGSVVLSCTVTNSLGAASAPGTATVAIVAAPATPVITAPASVTADATGLVASVPAQTGSSYAWTISGGTITAGTGTTSITFTAGASGSVDLGCTVTNSLGVAGTPGTATVAIVAAPATPVITAPATVTTGAAGLAASIPAQTGSTYAWTITGGTITAGGTTTAITFTAGAAGSLVLGCTVTNSVGTASTPGTATVTVVAAPVATITAPSQVPAGSTNAASVPLQSGSTYAWTVTDGTIASGDGTNAITFTAGTDAGPMTLECVVTNAAGTSADSGLDTITFGPLTALMVVSISDASVADWATIGVKVLAIGLIPEGGTGADAVPVYTASAPAPAVNLVQLDQLSEILNRAAVAPGTYSGAVLTLGANPGDVTLVTAAAPSPGFPDAAATAIPAGRIQIQGATGGAGSLTVPVTVDFASALVVSAGQTSVLDLEFNLAHPALIVDHRIAGDPAPLWAVQFNGPVRHHPAAGTGLVLRHLYGTVAAVAPDQTAITVTKDNPTWPVVSPETAQPTAQSLSFLADAGNGTRFYDLDSGTASTIMDFSSVAGTLPGRFVRIAARFQPDGSLVAARIWASNSFSPVFAGPEGHVLNVDAAAGVLTVQDPSGTGEAIQVTDATRFFLRTPGDGRADAAPAGAGAAFLGASLARGFKVHASADPASSPMTAQSVDIEAGSAAPEPAALPMGTVAGAWSGGSFSLSPSGGGGLVPVDLELAGGSATLVYQVDRTGGVVTVTPVDITTGAGLDQLGGSLVNGAVVKVFGFPEAGGRFGATALFYYTGTAPVMPQ